MKLKKLFAGIVAVAMMATMAAPAFATNSGTETTNTISFSSNAVNSVKLTKNYKVENGTAPAENLQFKLTYWKESDVATSGTENAIANEKTYNADFTEGDTVAGLTADSSKTFDIDLTELGINRVGKYYFKVQEVAGTKASVDYDSNVRVLVVSAVNKVNADKKLEEGIEYYAALYELGADGETLGSKISGDNAFNNAYGAENVFKIDLSKEVRGEFADRNKDFTFNISFKAAEGKTANDYYGATVVLNGSPEVWAIDEAEHIVTLKHGDTFVINNLPAGVTYTITEDFEDADWSTKVNDVAGKVATGSIEANATIAYVNTHNGVPDTGVILDNAPYIALMAIVVAGAAVMVIKKRRYNED